MPGRHVLLASLLLPAAFALRAGKGPERAVVAGSEPAPAQRSRGQDRYRSEDFRQVPEWELDPEFAPDAFTFVRVRYSTWGGGRYNWRGDWATDYPDSDLNFSFRLQQLTSLAVHPDGIVLELTDAELFDYPFLYMIEPGELLFGPDEVVALRRYCLNGGFLMVDDFWGDREWDNFRSEIKRVFPYRPVVDVPLEHEIFHIVYDLKEKPQVPSIHAAQRGRSYERGYDTQTANYRAIEDDQGRIMVFICHNTDLGDGWEREGVAEWYFEEYSEKKAYPMGINIVTYALTH